MLARKTKQERIDELFVGLKEAMLESGMWLLIRKSDRVEIEKQAHSLAAKLVDRAIPDA